MDASTTAPATTAASAAPPATAPATPPADDVAALRAELAALKSAEEARQAAAAKAGEEAAAKAEEERKAKLSAEQKFAEELAAQRSQIEETRKQLADERRNLALDRLGVAEKFRQFAPAVDPGDPKGAKALESWAKENPELLRQQAAPVSDALSALRTKAGSALQKVLSGEKKSTLVTERNLSKMR